MCSNPHALVVKLPLKGQSKIYRLGRCASEDSASLRLEAHARASIGRRCARPASQKPAQGGGARPGARASPRVPSRRTRRVARDPQLARWNHIHVSPTVLVNGLEESQIGSSWSADQWHAFLAGLP